MASQAVIVVSFWPTVKPSQAGSIAKVAIFLPSRGSMLFHTGIMLRNFWATFGGLKIPSSYWCHTPDQYLKIKEISETLHISISMAENYIVPKTNTHFYKNKRVRRQIVRVSRGGVPCSLPKLPYVPMLLHVFLICCPFNKFADELSPPSIPSRIKKRRRKKTPKT